MGMKFDSLCGRACMGVECYRFTWLWLVKLCD